MSSKAKSKTAKATAAKAATKAEAVVEKPVAANKETGTELIELPVTAMQVKRGEEIVGALQLDYNASDQIKSLTGSRENYKREARAKTTLAMMQLIETSSFDPVASYAGEAKWRKELQKAYVSLGIRKPDGSLTEMGSSFYPPMDADDRVKETPDYKRRKAVQQNLATLLKACTRHAEGIRLKGLTAEYLPESHTLRISGPNLPAAIAGKGKKTVDLLNQKDGSERASFEALSRIADKQHDPKGFAEKQARAAGGSTDVDKIAHNAASSDKDLGALCAALVTAVNSLNSTVTATQRKHLQSVWDCLDKFLSEAKDA